MLQILLPIIGSCVGIFIIVMIIIINTEKSTISKLKNKLTFKKKEDPVIDKCFWI